MDERLAEAREAAGEELKKRRERVSAARDELEQKATSCRRHCDERSERDERGITAQGGRADLRPHLEGHGAARRLAIAFAVVILVWPSIGLTALIALFGAFALVSGVTTIVGALQRSPRGGDRVWLVLDGLLGIAVGVVVFVWPGLSALGLLYAVAAWAIATGILEMGFALAARSAAGRTLLMLGGVCSVAFGVIMLAHPGAGAVALLALVGRVRLGDRA